MTIPNTANNKKYLTTKEVAVYIRKTVNAVNNLTRRKGIPFRYVGGRRKLFKREEIDIWIEESSGVSLDEWRKNQS